MESLANALKNVGLEKIKAKLLDLGVESLEDLTLLDEDTIQQLQLTYIQRRKLNTLIKSAEGEATDSYHPKRKRMSSPTCSDFPSAEYSSHFRESRGREKTSRTSINTLMNDIQKQCTIVARTRDLLIYEPKMEKIYEDKSNNFRKKVFGKPNPSLPERVILVVGATGSGKTTLINGMINYLFSVEFNTPFRYKLILEAEDGSGKQTESQTKWITAYTLYKAKEFPIPYNLTIIDTPGFGDTSGVKRDIEITHQIKLFFSTPGHQGIDHIDAIGFVAQSCLSRLTPTQQYIFDSILSLFGKDVEENIFLLLTFADGKKPQVLTAIEEGEIPCNHWFKFNNSVLFSEREVLSQTNRSDDENFDELFWKMGANSYKKFFLELSVSNPKSLCMTKTVLDTRTRIEFTIQGLQEEIHSGLTELERLKSETVIVLKHQTIIDQNKNFTYTVFEDVINHEPIPSGKYITNCLECNTTCHYPCHIPNNENKKSCSSMSLENCVKCFRKCHWSKHVNNNFKIVTIRKFVTKDSEELKQRYHQAQGDIISAESIVKEILNEVNARKLKVMAMTNEVRILLEKLAEIALKPNPLSTLDYINILIDSERNNAKPGFKERIVQLEDIKKDVEFIDSAIKRGENPFEEYQIKIKEDTQMQNGGAWEAVGKYLKEIDFFDLFRFD